MTTEEALKWIAELFEEPVENINPETQKDEIAGWDSLGVLNLMAGLDEDFDILLSEEELSELQKIDDILKILKEHGKLN